MRETGVSRRSFVGAGFGAGFVLAFAPRPAYAQAELPETPACSDAHDPTPRQTEGPYFKPRSPERSDLTGDGPGEAVLLAGYVLTTTCKPVPRALVELWHADSSGAYDNAGYRFRAHVFTDGAGRYRFTTVVPGLYPGRTRHFHLKVQPEGGRVLTTQTYFPDEPANQRDRIFDPRLLMTMSNRAGTRLGRYDFVVRA